MLPEINNYFDLIKKLDYDLKRYQRNNHIYELLDCIMTLNALPEWIIESLEASDSLKKLAFEKIQIMKGLNGFIFDEDKLNSDLDHKLRFIRLICNHSKHKTDSKQIRIIKSAWGATLSMTLPAKLDFIIEIGNQEIDAEELINDVANFWKTEVFK